MRLSNVSGVVLSGALALGGCGPEQQVVGGPPAENSGLQTVGPADPCGAGRLQGLVGQEARAANVAALPAESRILYPDMSAGTAFRQDRVTVEVDNASRITGVRCG
jgi:hypothetical protein